jgi:putative ubiquitin-RnfH superfamily antitoxin RatB of RatAB toxin-antitoxin module
MVKIELVYAPVEQKMLHLFLELKPGATVAEALISSGVYEVYPETKDSPIGIYSKRVSLDTVLQEGDRLELYRSLAFDPKERRRQKASSKEVKQSRAGI